MNIKGGGFNAGLANLMQVNGQPARADAFRQEYYDTVGVPVYGSTAPTGGGGVAMSTLSSGGTVGAVMPMNAHAVLGSVPGYLGPKVSMQTYGSVGTLGGAAKT